MAVELCMSSIIKSLNCAIVFFLFFKKEMNELSTVFTDAKHYKLRAFFNLMIPDAYKLIGNEGCDSKQKIVHPLNLSRRIRYETS